MRESPGHSDRTCGSKFMMKWRHVAVIDREIRAGRYPSAPRLARLLELSARTVKRHIEFMRYDLGAPIEYDASRKGYYYREPDWRLPAIRVSEGELFAVALAEQALRGITNPELAEKVRRVFRKITVQLPDEIQVDPAALADGIGFQPGPGPFPEEGLLETLARAVREGRIMRVIYHKLGADEVVERDLDPYLLRCIDGEWYLIAHAHQTGYVSIFHTSRIEELEETGETFDRDEVDFDAEEYFEHSLGASHSEDAVEVAIRFRGWAARYVAEREWHPTQQIAGKPDSTIVLRMQVGWLQEVASWVMQFGEKAEALEPPQLRQMVRDRLVATVAQYSD